MYLINRQVLAQVLDSIQNVHPSITGEKMSFINALLDSEVNVLRTQGEWEKERESEVVIYRTVIA